MYFFFNGFLFNNFLNKLLYRCIENGYVIFSIFLERYFMTYYVYHFLFFNFLKKLNIFLKKFLTFRKMILLTFIYVFLLFFLYINQNIMPSLFFLDILHDINV